MSTLTCAETPPLVAARRQKILAVEALISQLPGAQFGDQADCPLTHAFAGGIYIREMFCPQGKLVVTKIHKLDHPYFVLQGDVSVLTEQGFQRVRAPFSGVTKAGTKRVCYAHTDTVWTTLHVVGDERNLTVIEAQLIAPTFDDVQPSGFDLAWFRELTKKVLAAEKPGYWSDWTAEQRDCYTTGDWESFSRSRGYSEAEIGDLRAWLFLLDEGQRLGMHPLARINDLVLPQALHNALADRHAEIAQSSHLPQQRIPGGLR